MKSAPRRRDFMGTPAEQPIMHRHIHTCAQHLVIDAGDGHQM
jgi:hypothetical protein